MKRYFITLIIIVCAVMQSQAVLKEKDLSRTIGCLKLELRNSHIKQRSFMARLETQQKAQHAQLVDYMQRSEQIGLMLYSQKSDFTFDMAYACQQATLLYNEMNRANMPYDEYRENILREVARYDSLIFILQQLPPAIGKGKSELTAADSLLFKIEAEKIKSGKKEAKDESDIFILSEAEQEDREKCIMHAKSLRNNMIRILNTLTKDKQYYDNVNRKVERLKKYADFRYKIIQNNIFKKGDSNYFKFLSNLPRTWMRIKADFADKYSILNKNDRRYSQWRGPQVVFVSFAMVFYLLIASIISNIILRWIVPKKYRTESYKKKRHAYILSLGILLFGIVLLIIQHVFDGNSLINMATKLMLNMTWLMIVVIASLLIRLDGDQIKSGVRMYEPFMALAFVVILFRIILIPNQLLNLVFPPIMLLFTIWQILIARKTRKNVPMSDKFYNIISLFTIITSCIISWVGYSLLAVQITIWWTFQLTAIQTITCLYDLMEMYENKYLVKRILRKEHSDDASVTEEQIIKKMHDGEYVSITWMYDLVNRAFVPILGVLSVILSIAFAADTFEMRAICHTLFRMDIVNSADIIRISLDRICLITALFFVFRYANYSIRSFYFSYKKAQIKEQQEENEEKNRQARNDFNRTLVRNVVAITVWGIYIIICMVILEIPKDGIKVVSAGLATGMGFAMKDLLENFFYGISLMTGRLRVGDYIECDGVQGKVDSITYQSTQIAALDGSVIAFLNSSLFSKNFKNLTRNHQYELIKIPVGVAYGTDITKVRKLLLDGLRPLATKTEDGRDIVDPAKGINVVFADFGASSVDLFVTQWLLVDQKISYQAKAKEAIYNILNENHIEIPFPQQDIYIRNITSENTSLNELK
ncbi:MAG: mechanosensitive ion channel [Bacteroidaceae bacterium]|nr:mechanosensitive ion channel [Bacteroidaceae bacterium]